MFRLPLFGQNRYEEHRSTDEMNPTQDQCTDCKSFRKK